MTFPHPQSRKDHYRKEDKPSCGGVVWNFFKWTINITEYRNAKDDDVNPAKNRTFGGNTHDLIPSIENLLKQAGLEQTPHNSCSCSFQVLATKGFDAALE